MHTTTIIFITVLAVIVYFWIRAFLKSTTDVEIPEPNEFETKVYKDEIHLHNSHYEDDAKSFDIKEPITFGISAKEKYIQIGNGGKKYLLKDFPDIGAAINYAYKHAEKNVLIKHQGGETRIPINDVTIYDCEWCEDTGRIEQWIAPDDIIIKKCPFCFRGEEDDFTGATPGDR